MKVYFVTFRSITFAQRGERVLQQNGFTCTLLRTPRWMEERGCGYCLQLRGLEVGGAVELLRKRQVQFRKIYCQQDGITEEVQL